MLLYVGKVMMLFTVSIFVIRLLGKAALSQLTSHDLTAIIFLVSIAVNPLLSDKMSETIAGIAVVMVLYLILSKLALFRWLNKLLIGEPTILVKHGKIVKMNLRRTHYSLLELLAALRSEGFPDLNDVEYAILEPTGDISIIPKKEIIPVTPKLLNISVAYEGLPISIVVEGKIQTKNLKLIGKDEEWVKQKLASAGFHTLGNIFYAAVKDNDESLVVDTGEES